MTVEPNDAAELLGVDLTSGYTTMSVVKRSKFSTSFTNPSVGGQALRVQMTETVEPSEWQMDEH